MRRSRQPQVVAYPPNMRESNVERQASLLTFSRPPVLLEKDREGGAFPVVEPLAIVAIQKKAEASLDVLAAPPHSDTAHKIYPAEARPTRRAHLAYIPMEADELELSPGDFVILR